MGEPALQLLSAEAAAGEAAAKQTTRLIVIEGGKRAALTTGQAVATEGAVSTVGRIALLALGSTAAAAGAFLLALLWPSSLGDGTLKQQPKPAESAATPSAIPKRNEETIQRCPESKNCPPHEWVLWKEGKSVDDATRVAQDRLAELSKSPSQSDTMRGVAFEQESMDLNNKKHPIDTVGAIYKCRRCGAEQEVDILFKDGQIAESKSANLKSVKKKSKQSQRLLDLQSSLNCNKGTNFKPLAKLDANHSDIDSVAQKYNERGYEVERLSTSATRQ